MKLTALIILAALAFLGGLFFFSRKLLYFPAKISVARLDHLRSGIDGVIELEIPVDNHVILHGWLVQKDMTGLPTVFYFGGNAEEVSLNLADYAVRLPANVVMVNYRGYGKSSGTPTEAALKSDALRIYDTLADQYGLDPARTVAWGRSLGSSMACYLALERDLGKLILTCPFDSIEQVAGAYYPAWLVGLVLRDRHRTIDFCGQIRSKTLILASKADEVIPTAHTLNLYEHLTCEKELVYIEGAGHNTISEFGSYFDTVNKFLGATPFSPLQKPE